MNLSKKEKLLAARKKLKEFQLGKMQSVSSQDNHALTSKITNCNVSGDYNHGLSSMKDHNKVSEIPEYILNSKEQNNILQTEKTKDDTSNIESMPDSSIPKMQNEESDNLYVEASSLTEHKESSKTTNDTFFPQTDSLLKMVSEVADALTDDNEKNGVFENNDLESHNQILSTSLEQHKQIINQLNIKIGQYVTRLSELEGILSKKNAESEEKLVRELSPLKEQLNIHVQTTGILIAEKAELTSALNQSQADSKQKSEDIEKLSVKLKSYQLHINELEKELAAIKYNSDDAKENVQQMQHDFNVLKEDYDECRHEKEDLYLEVSELKQKLNLKNAELTNLQQELQEKSALLSLNELRIQQLTSTSQDLQLLEGQHHSVTMLEQQLTQMKETLKLVNDEKDEANKQYQQYVKHLDEQQRKLQKQVEDGQKLIEDLEIREQSYIKRLSDLEQQLQREKEKVDSLLPLESHREKIESMTRTIDELTLQEERLQMLLIEKNGDIEMLEEQLRELQEKTEENVKASKLAIALESEQVGASRAVSQNQQLKMQLSEMHDAFVQLSNSKLDLTEQLQAERSIGRKLNIQLNHVESETEDLRKQLKEKEDALIELEKAKLQCAQINDQMQHYQAQSNQSRTLEQELQNAIICIDKLTRERDDLSKQLQLKGQTTVNEEDLNVDRTSTNLIISSDKSQTDDVQASSDASSTSQALSGNSHESLNSIEPLRKLEGRFKETMEKMAELTDEKQRLEHLVLQLQGETETIGEYITLYQKQRAILHERNREKDKRFQQLLEQRNLQQEQLHKLKVLVADLIKKVRASSSEVNETIEGSTKDSKEIVSTSDDRPIAQDGTASQILDLLTEIKDCKDTCVLEPNFHPCPWCSGKLITV
ncbi:golgin subfamily A member 2-like isoform X2 [Prorops nasuta]|uniref:golgin subfamily A member 2-like isoform X2 n=1 Tax=Prorops nasuta TaxID=863751 RepID=UPI0034CDB103